MAKDAPHTAHRTGTRVNRSQVAEDTAHRAHKARAPVNNRQVATATLHKNTLGAHTGEQAPRARGHRTHLHT